MFLKEITKYEGDLLHDRFAYQFFKEASNPLGDIIAFRGEMEVLADNMIDSEDVMNQAFIYSDDAVNFLWELPVLGNSHFGAVAFQQLFNREITDILQSESQLNQPLYVKGDDIYHPEGKCSVSITHVKDGAALGHTGINIHAGSNAPSHAYSTQLTDAQVDEFIERVTKRFYSLCHELFIATSKIRL